MIVTVSVAVMIVLMIVRYVVIVMVIMIVVMVFQTPLQAGFLQFGFEHAANRWIFLLLFDLFNLEWNTQALRKVSLGDGKVSSGRGAGVEVLVKPEKRRRNDRACLPVHLHGFVVFQSALAG